MSRILLIDDDARTRDLVTAILQAGGYTVSVAPDGESGINAALGAPGPDLIVTDLNMRGTSGWDVGRRRRADPECGSLPILALSAYTTAQDRDEAFDAGVTAYETKPVDRERLLAKVDELLR